MAEADTAVPANEDGIFHNPAALADLTSRSVRAQTLTGIEDVRAAGLGLLWPTPRAGTWGIQINNATAGTMEVNDDLGTSVGSLDAQTELAASAAWGGNLQRISKKLPSVSLGATARYFREEVAETGAETGQAVDLGAQYRLFKKRAVVGLAVQNLGGRIGPDDLPQMWSAGASYTLGKWALHRCLIDLDIARLANEETSPRLGAEYSYKGLLTLRAGMALRGEGNEDQWAGGMGFRLPLGSSRVEIDYAYRSVGDLGGTHGIDLTYRWTPAVKKAAPVPAKTAPAPVKKSAPRRQSLRR